MNTKLVQLLQERIDTIEYNIAQGGSYIEAHRKELEGKIAAYKEILFFLNR
jgi:hypothetical protein